jgi:2-polyprenyl-6-methoxyphenol hydroxylase-like FAD-dependent oxidoreductase
MTEHAVVIAGGGPTGMMLAGELTLGGVDVAIVERRGVRRRTSTKQRSIAASGTSRDFCAPAHFVPQTC